MKAKHYKPGLYAMFYAQLKDIAEHYGYNLLIHGSMNRDLDLVAVPWVDNPRPEVDMINDMFEYLTGMKSETPKDSFAFSVLPGGRHSYVINLNRGDRNGEWVRFMDEEYYLDISVFNSIQYGTFEGQRYPVGTKLTSKENGELIIASPDTPDDLIVGIVEPDK